MAEAAPSRLSGSAELSRLIEVQAPLHEKQVQRQGRRNRLLDLVLRLFVFSFVAVLVPFVVAGLFFGIEYSFRHYSYLFGFAAADFSILIICSWLLSSKAENMTIIRPLLDHYGRFRYAREAPARRIDANLPRACLPDFDAAQCFDTIEGTYRGQPVAIMEALLHAIDEDDGDKVTLFHGLVIETRARHTLKGTYHFHSSRFAALETIVGPFERIKLESPDFEAVLSLWGTDQIEGRIFMTPRRMERWTKMAEGLGTAILSVYLAEGRVGIMLDLKTDFIDGRLMHEGSISITRLYTALAHDFDRIFALIDFFAFDEFADSNATPIGGAR